MNNGFIAPPTSGKKLREWARITRRQLGFENKLYLPIVHILEWALPEEWHVVISEEAEMGSKHGEVLPLEKVVKIRQDVYYGAIENKGRDRFTVAHELAHACLHGSLVTFARVAPNQKVETFRLAEWQADRGAGELLVPCHLIGGMTAETISQQCGVSLSAAQTQLRNCVNS